MKTRRYRSAYKAGKAAGYAEGYMKGLHDGNPFVAIAEAASNIIKKITDPEFVEAYKEAKNMYDEERRRELDEEDRYADFLEAQEREETEPVDDDREDERHEINRRWK